MQPWRQWQFRLNAEQQVESIEYDAVFAFGEWRKSTISWMNVGVEPVNGEKKERILSFPMPRPQPQMSLIFLYSSIQPFAHDEIW